MERKKSLILPALSDMSDNGPLSKTRTSGPELGKIASVCAVIQALSTF